MSRAKRPRLAGRSAARRGFRHLAARRTVAAVLSAILVLLASPAGAATPSATVALRRDAGVLWAESSVSEGEATTMKIKFFAPRRADAARRELWQVCKFPYRGAAVYRCGIDVSRGSLARKRSGTWMVRVLADDVVVAKRLFSL